MHPRPYSLPRLALAGALLTAALASHPATAAEGATVAAVQQHAWVERDGRQSALSPGQTLQSGDTLYTGQDARLILNLPDQSTLKLGENLHLSLTELTPASESGGVMRAVIDVLRGAFRYTTAATDGSRRDITVKVDSIALGIRGTDVWGKAAEDTDMVCLIVGRVEVSSGDLSHTLTEHRQFFVVPEGESPRLGTLEAEKLAQWAQQTELQ